MFFPIVQSFSSWDFPVDISVYIVAYDRPIDVSLRRYRIATVLVFSPSDEF